MKIFFKNLFKNEKRNFSKQIFKTLTNERKRAVPFCLIPGTMPEMPVFSFFKSLLLRFEMASIDPSFSYSEFCQGSRNVFVKQQKYYFTHL